MDDSIREPEQIRSSCAAKLRQVETGGMFTAILAALLGEDWTNPRIEELLVTPDRHLLARTSGDVSHRQYLGVEADLINNIHGIAEVAGLDGDELGYLLGRLSKAKRIE